MTPKEIRESVKEIIEKAKVAFDRDFRDIPVECNIKKGAALAGSFRWKNYGEEVCLRFNKEIAKNNPDNFIDTIIHEIAHFIVHEIYGYKKSSVKSHGKEWKFVMRKLGAKPKRLHNYQIDGYSYSCECNQKHTLTKIRHRKAQRGTKYCCLRCKKTLKFNGKEIIDTQI